MEGSLSSSGLQGRERQSENIYKEEEEQTWKGKSQPERCTQPGSGPGMSRSDRGRGKGQTLALHSTGPGPHRRLRGDREASGDTAITRGRFN